MAASDIVIKGAREHNLRNVEVVLPRNQLICLTGVSGSGKSSLAFDTLYAEGQRRYVESLSTFARQFLGQMPKPDVDHISGLSPSISISQKSSGNNPRSTVGTITEIYDYLRVLYARAGQGHCPQCQRAITAQTREQIIQRILELPQGTKFLVLAPIIRAQKGEHRDLFEDLLKQGFVRARVDGRVIQLTDDPQLDRRMRHNIEVVVDRLTVNEEGRARLAEAVELALKLGEGSLIVSLNDESAKPIKEAPREETDEADSEEGQKGEEESTKSGKRKAKSGSGGLPGDITLSAHYACTHCGLSFEPPSPQLFSFNSPQGMCSRCDGLGEIYGFDPEQLVTDASLSFKQGCIELIGAWRDMGRWRRHIYQGVADTIEYKRSFESGSMLETAWKDVDPALKELLLWGTGEEHITFTWRGGSSGMKYGGHWEGLIPQLLNKYRTSKNKMQRRQLEKFMRIVPCGACHGARLNPQARSVRLSSANPRFAEQAARSLPEVCGLSISDAVAFFQELQLDATGQKIAGEVLKEIRGRLGFLENVGLEYLTLDRTAPTLSGGESQRIRLAGQVGCGLVGVLYILDEPSIGLHPRDNDRLLNTLTQLRDKGNTVVVVEHDEDTMRAADHLIDFGPGPGVRGGEVIVGGTLEMLMKESRSVTGQFLSGKRRIETPVTRRMSEAGLAALAAHGPIVEGKVNGKRAGRQKLTENGAPLPTILRVVGARHNNLKNVTVEIPLGKFVCVTGASGSGKSSLVNDILVEALNRDLNKGEGTPGDFDRIEGLEGLDKLIAIDQSPIGRTPRSNPSTYIKVFDDIRDLYTQMSEAKARGYKAGRFSFNVSGGRCEACEGNGSNRLEMDFLADVWVTCPVCEGKRFNRETLQIRFKGKSIADVLEMDIQQALVHFENIPQVRHKLQTLHDVGLDYLKLGQPSPTLSGGEAQRIKLARELVKKSTGRTLYLLDEPTTGLHFADIQLLLKVLHDFVDAGNTVLVVEHNLDVIKTADWIIDLGPDGGAGGGEIVAVGTPEMVVAQVNESEQAAKNGAKKGKSAHPFTSYTGISLRKALQDAESPTKRASRRKPIVESAKSIIVRGAREHNLQGVDVEIPRDGITVCCGLSGSGKSSLAMDTIYAEGQRRYVESLSSYARQFVGQMQKPRLDHIEGLSPAIAIEQKNMGHTPRSTVGTVTEIYDYLRVLMARLGKPYCPACNLPIGTQSADEVIEKLMEEPEGTKLYLMAAVEVEVGRQYEALWEDLRGQGYARVRIDGQTHSLEQPPVIDRRRKHQVEVVIDRIVVRPDARSRIAGSVEQALALGKGVLSIAYPLDDVPEAKWRTIQHSQHYACDQCGRSFERLTPHRFSFNSALGWCPACEGLGTGRGANLQALLRDPKLTLAQGALALWPSLELPLAQRMLAALSAQTGIPLDVPFDQLPARQRRVLLHGTEEEWINVPRAPVAGKKESKASARANAEAPFLRFQFKGLYPALEEASKLSPSLRGRLEHLIDEVECSTCGGSRLRDDASATQLRGRTIDDICREPLGTLIQWFEQWKPTGSEKKIAGELLREVRNRLQFLVDVGLEYLTLNRSAPTLSGGESQRIRLGSQVGSGLCGVLYVLDEPTIGLHPRDNRRLLTALEKLRDLGNTLLMVEHHDKEVIEAADQLLDFGPGAGEFGGRIVARGKPVQVAKQKDSVTGPYLSGKKSIGIPLNRRGQEPPKETGKTNGKTKTVFVPKKMELSWLEIQGARHNNLRNLNVKIPLGTLTAITGVSGSGKSSLIEDVLYNSLARTLHRAAVIPGAHDKIVGLELINKVIRVDQQPLGNTPTSNPATYTGAFDLIRQLFAQLPDAKLRGYSPRCFSFNVPGGRCEACEGAGQKRIEMHFLPDVWVECDACRGQRYNPETLAVLYHGQSISDVLNMSCGKATKLFENIPKIRRILGTLCDVGLDYLTLGQSATTLSGGEAQRVKLAAELSRPDTGRTLYLLDEPTTGLHFDDLAKLLEVLNRLVDLGNTVVVIEHNLDVIKTADWIIDLGPEAGAGGGYVVAQGTPEQVVAPAQAPAKNGEKTNGKGKAKLDVQRSHTAEALAPVLAAGPYVKRNLFDFVGAVEEKPTDLDIEEVGKTVKMPWETHGRQWHTHDRVGRNGEACRWDGEFLGRVIDKIHELGEFSETDWNNRSIVEIAAKTKSDGWFFHAITGETWLLKLKFRTARHTFDRQKLTDSLDLKPLNEMPDLPVYGREPRVKIRTQRGPWQEVELRVHQGSEIDKPAFWKMLEEAVAGFRKLTEKVRQNPNDIMPWKVLGQKWHFSRKGFPPGKKVQWEAELLEELCELLNEAAPGGQFLWNNQQLVHYYLAGHSEPWATIITKRLAALELILNGPKGKFPLGRVSELGADREVHSERGDRDAVRLTFVTSDDLTHGDLAFFLAEHAAAVGNKKGKKAALAAE